MNALEKYFFTPVYYPRSMWSVLGWWESRRPLYNVAVGAAGVATILTATAIELLPPHGSPVLIPWGVLARGVLVYGVLANVCYPLGAPADLLLRRVLGDRAAAAGPVLFRYGFVFSLGLTLLPIPIAAIGWVFRLISG
jgi:hypothetical protein